ncbi:MAG: Crp/Fnr family transcriptional regulator [Rhodoferax sp.]|nr:Crp/Fnr family transcriptional regulator [Rhodoferax sp.]
MSTDLDRFVADDTFPTLIRALAARGATRRYRKGTILINEGDFGDTIFIVLVGRVKVFSDAASDKEITFGIFGPGEYVGEMAIDGGPRSASVITLEPVACAVVARAALLAFIAEKPEFAITLLSKVIQRLRLATRDARNLAFIDVYGRLNQCVQALAVPGAAGTLVVPERLTHVELASRVGCSREMVSRILKDLESGGYVRLVDRRIHLMAKLPQRW